MTHTEAKEVFDRWTWTPARAIYEVKRGRLLSDFISEMETFQTLNFVPEQMRNSREVVYAAVGAFPRSFIDVPTQYKDDVHLAELAVTQDLNVFAYTSDALKNNKEFVLKMMLSKKEAWILRHASKEIRGDATFLMQACREGCKAVLEYASEDLRNDLAFVLAVVKLDHNSVEFVGTPLRSHQEIFLAAADSRCSIAWFYAGRSLMDNKDFVLEMFSRSYCACHLKHVSERLRDDWDVVHAAMNYDWTSIPGMPQCLKDEKKKTFDMWVEKRPHIRCSMCASAHTRVSLRLQRDQSILLAAIGRNYKAFSSMRRSLKTDITFVKAAVGKNCKVFKLLDRAFQNDSGIALISVETNGMSIKRMPQRIKNLRHVAWAAIKNNPQAFWKIPEVLRDEKAFVMEALKHRLSVRVPEPLLTDHHVVFEATFESKKPIWLACYCNHPLFGRLTTETMFHIMSMTLESKRVALM